MNVTIVGAGNGGLAATADLTLRGFQVVLYEHPDFRSNVDPIRSVGKIGLSTLPSTGLSGGFAGSMQVTTHAAEAFGEADMVLIVIPAFAQPIFIDLIAPHLRKGQKLVLMPGGFGGAVLCYKKLTEDFHVKDVLVAETSTIPYACRKLDPTSVWIRGRKASFEIAAYPGRDTNEVLKAFQLLYPHAVAATNVLQTALSNLNPFIHPPIMLLNAGSVDRRERTLFYHEALTASARQLIEALDKERLMLGKAFGLDLKPAHQVLLDHYQHQGARGENIQEVAGNNPIYRWSYTPGSLDSRYLTEDLPMSLVPIAELAKQVDSPRATMEALVSIGSAVLGRDLSQGARTLAQTGMEDLRPGEMVRALENGMP